MNRLQQVTSVALCVLLTSGCATIVVGPSQSLPITSDPSGAVVDLRCAGAEPQAAVTPAKLRLSRKATECTVSVTTAGHYPVELSLERQRSGWFWVNLVPGAVIDIVTVTLATLTAVYGNDSGGGGAGFLLAVAVAGGGMLIDRGTGAMYGQAPDRIDVTLTPLDASADRTPEGAPGMPAPEVDP
jgi:hypothetical protein